MLYARYDKKKSGSKGGKQKSSQNSTSKKSDSKQGTDTPTYYRCKNTYSKGHEKVCRAINAKCDSCGTIGHFAKCCRKSGNFPKKGSSTKKQHVASAYDKEVLFYDEDRNIRHKSSALILSKTQGKKELMIEFWCGQNINSIDKKITMKIDTGAHATNRKTLRKLFPDTELQPSTVILENYDST